MNLRHHVDCPLALCGEVGELSPGANATYTCSPQGDEVALYDSLNPAPDEF
jgi:hypothetical protein